MADTYIRNSTANQIKMANMLSGLRLDAGPIYDISGNNEDEELVDFEIPMDVNSNEVQQQYNLPKPVPSRVLAIERSTF